MGTKVAKICPAPITCPGVVTSKDVIIPSSGANMLDAPILLFTFESAASALVLLDCVSANSTANEARKSDFNFFIFVSNSSLLKESKDI